MGNDKTWLLSSAGRRGALVKILQNAGGTRNRVIAVDASNLSAAGVLADEFELVPRVDNPEFVAVVSAICEKYGVDFIVPTIDPEIHVYAQNRQVFQQLGAEPLVSSEHVVALGWDKWLFSKWLDENNFPGPKTVEVSDKRGLENLTGPVIAKPRNGSSSVGIIEAQGANELPEYLTDDYIVQERANGIEVTIDIGVGADGNILGAVPRRRIETRAGEVSKGVTVFIPGVQKLITMLVNRLDGVFGVINIQLFVDPKSGGFSIIELNPRFGGGYPLTHAAGADFAGALLQESAVPVSWEPGVVMLRYDDAVFYDDPTFVEEPWKGN